MNFEVFGVIFIAIFQVYASVYDTSDRHRRPSMHFDLNLARRRPARRTCEPGWSLWASGRRARRLAAGPPASAGVGPVD